MSVSAVKCDSQQLIIAEDSTIQSLYKWFSVIQMDSAKCVKKCILVEQRNVMIKTIFTYKIYYKSKFLREIPFNHTDHRIFAVEIQYLP